MNTALALVIIPHNHFRAQIGFDFHEDEIFLNPKELGAILNAPNKPLWYGVEINKEDSMRVFKYEPTNNGKKRQSVEDWLASKMRAGPKEKKKKEYFDEAIAVGYGIPRREFYRIWFNLVVQYPKYKWDKPGKIKGKSYSLRSKD